MEEAKTYCNVIFGAKEGSIWYEDWKLWTGLLGYGLVWGKWLLKGLDWSFESKTLQCFSLDLIFLHLLQYTRFGILMIFGMLLIQTLVLTYAAFVPLDLLKKGHFTAYSTYTRISGSLLQTCWIFLGQLLFGWFYLYSLYSSYDEVANAEYLFWFAGFISVQMTMFFARGADSHLGHGWNVSQAIYVFYHVEDLSFKKGMDDTSESFIISRAHWFLRSLFGFTINLLLREFIGYSVPILLMHFHNPIDCVIYSVAVNFIVTMDDISDTVYKVLRRRKSCQYDRLETGNVESVEHEVP